MFLPGIFNEFTVDPAATNEENKATTEKALTKENKHDPKSIVREFSTVSFTGPPPLETRKSVAKLFPVPEDPVVENKSFWSNSIVCILYLHDRLTIIALYGFYF